MSIIVTCNAGSATFKFSIFDAETLERKSHVILHDEQASFSWLAGLDQKDVIAIGHRVVHGGQEFTRPTVITYDVLSKIKGYTALAPLHQPLALEMILHIMKLYPSTMQVACFDTAFHHTLPEIERLLPIPRSYREKDVMRYGFHGLSYQYIASVLPEYVGTGKSGKVIVAHLGSGSSACAMKDLKSVATTMGFSTIDGMMMSTRSGALDPGVIFYMMRALKDTCDEVEHKLYHDSGLKGASAISGDMRELLASDKSEAREAINLYCYLAAKQICGLLPALGGLDALVFTGGVGENADAVRDEILRHLKWIGDFLVYVIPTNEERVIAEGCKEMV